MNDEKARQWVIQCMKKAGLEVVTDKAEMERVLGEPAEDAYDRELLQKMVFSYEEGESPPDLSPSVVSYRGRNGEPQEMYTVKFYGNRPKDYIPKRIGKAYKLMEQWPDGTLHALFAGTQEVHPMNEWNWAKGFVPDETLEDGKNYSGIKSMKLAPRFGWHMGTGVPSTHHLMGVGDIYHPVMCYPSKGGIGHPKGSKRVWVEVSYDATEDYTPVAEANPSNKEKDIRGLVPFGGYYMFQESNLSNWIVASSIRFDRVIPEEERQAILKDAGFDEELVWRKQTLRKHLKAAMTSNLNRLKDSGDKELVKNIQRLIDVCMENEEKIRSLSNGAEPTYPKEQLQAMAAVVSNFSQSPTPFVQPFVEHLEMRRKALAEGFKALTRSHPQRKLTQDEIRQERERIREGIIENPDYLDGEASLPLMDSTGRIQGFAKGNVIYLDPEQMHVDAPIHEYTHIWDRLCRRKNPKLWQEGVALLKQTNLWNAVKSSPFYADIAQDDDLVTSEVHARLTALQGKKLLQEAVGTKPLLSKLKAWQKKFWTFIKGKTACKSLTLDAFLKAPIADLATAKNICTR